jgi:hypothetical protein
LLMVPVGEMGRSWRIADDAALCAGRAPRPVLDNDLESTAGCRFAQVGLADAGSQWFRRREFRRGGGASFRGNSGASRITGTENLYDNFRHLISPIARQPEMLSSLTLGTVNIRQGGNAVGPAAGTSASASPCRAGCGRAGSRLRAAAGAGERLARGARGSAGPAAGMVGRVRRGDPRKGVMTRPAVPG